jgi:hypothetical protein
MATMLEYPIGVGYPRVRQPRVVQAVPRRCLSIEGRGEPGGSEFEAAMAALYGTAYGLLFRLRDRGVEAHVGPSEALWERLDGEGNWAEGPVAFDPTAWRWTLMIPIAAEASDDDVATAIAAARARRPSPALDRLRVITLDEGLVVEAMHLGPYVDEPATIARMHELAAAQGLVPHGAHHEIYLGDPRRTAPENLRTVLRQPVERAAA